MFLTMRVCVCVCVCVSVCRCVGVGSHGGQKRELERLEMKLQEVVSYLICVLEAELNPLQEQQVLLATKSLLQPPCFLCSEIMSHVTQLALNSCYIVENDAPNAISQTLGL